MSSYYYNKYHIIFFAQAFLRLHIFFVPPLGVTLRLSPSSGSWQWVLLKSLNQPDKESIRQATRPLLLQSFLEQT